MILVWLCSLSVVHPYPDVIWALLSCWWGDNCVLDSLRYFNIWSLHGQFGKKDKRFKETQKRNFDRHHHAKVLPDLPDGQTVWITSGATPVKGTVISSQSEQPRLYDVRVDVGLLQRNRIHLNPVPNKSSCTEQVQDTSAAEPKRITTVCSVAIKTVNPIC